MTKRDRLGKGLGALLGEYMEPEVETADITRIPVRVIVPNPMQPRQMFTEAELVDLSASIQVNGLLQPLVVRLSPEAPGRYELIAGERRLRAVGRLGWTDVPVVIREASDETLLILALVENLQREALNALEEAEGYQALTDNFGMSQGEIAEAVGKDRSTVANLVRLLKLPTSVRKLLEQGRLSPGHARALLAVENPVRAGELARKAVAEGWSVREVERRSGAAAKKKRNSTSDRVDPVVRGLEDALQEHLATRVTIQPKRGGKGVIQISYHDPQDFERLYELITSSGVPGVAE
jgi:ParB family chromosome partitioning protein